MKEMSISWTSSSFDYCLFPIFLIYRLSQGSNSGVKGSNSQSSSQQSREQNVNFREREKQILDKILGSQYYDRRIRPSGANGTGIYINPFYFLFNFFFKGNEGHKVDEQLRTCFSSWKRLWLKFLLQSGIYLKLRKRGGKSWEGFSIDFVKVLLE